MDSLTPSPHHIYSVELRFFGDSLDPVEISSILGLRPSTYSSRDEPLIGRPRRPFWGYSGCEHPDFQTEWASLEEGLTFVAERLSARKSEIIELSRRFDGLWWCGHFQGSFDGGPTLSAHILGVVASFGCSLFIDNYFSSEDDSPEALSPPT